MVVQRASERDEGGSPARVVRHEISLRSIFTLLAIALGLWLLLRLWSIVLLLVIALILAGTLAPVIIWLERRRVSRPLGLALVLLALVGMVVGLGVLVIPAFATQVSDVVSQAPALREQAANIVATLPGLGEAAETIRTGRPSSLLSNLGNQLIGYAGVAAQTVVYGLLTVVLAFYLLADHERVQGFFFALLPRRYHLRTARVLLDMGTVVGGYVRGQVVTSLLIGVFTFVVLLIAGVPNALALAVFAAFADLIPLVGAALAVIPPALVALTQGPVVGLAVFVALFLYSQVENHLINPRIYGQTLRLSPLAVLVALIVGGELLGIVGALLALPLAAGIRVLVEDLRIELPGDQPGEATLRAEDERDERRYEAQAAGASAVEAAVIATALVEERQEETAERTGQREIPAEERSDDGAFETPEGTAPGSLPNPAR